MRTVHEIFTMLDSVAPVTSKLDFDNVGLLAGGAGWQVGSVLLSLDITDDVIDEAKELGAELIVSHHPLFFSLKARQVLIPAEQSWWNFSATVFRRYACIQILTQPTAA